MTVAQIRKFGEAAVREAQVIHEAAAKIAEILAAAEKEIAGLGGNADDATARERIMELVDAD